MRVSTNQFFQMGFGSINKHQNNLLDIQEKLSTMKRVNRPSDDPVAMSQIHSLNRTKNTIDQYKQNGEFAKSQLALEETNVTDTIDVLQRIRVLGIQMSNDTYNADQRRATAAEVQQLMQHVKGIMNTKNSEGEYAFAGNNVKDTPFVDDVDNPGFLIYIGNIDPNHPDPEFAALARPEANFGGRFVQIGFDHTDELRPNDEYNMSRVRITDAGSKVFGFEPYDSSTLVDGQDKNIYNTLKVMFDRLMAGEKPGDDVLDDLKNAITNMSEVVAGIGSRQVRIEAQYNAGEAFKISLQDRQKDIEELDVIEGISKFTVHQISLQMAQQVFSRVQQMSLFNYF